jgi:hypothetical protein
VIDQKPFGVIFKMKEYLLVSFASLSLVYRHYGVCPLKNWRLKYWKFGATAVPRRGEMPWAPDVAQINEPGSCSL